MKAITGIVIVTLFLLSAWACTHTAVKDGTAEQQTEAATLVRDKGVAEQPSGEIEENRGSERGQKKPELHIDQKKEAESIYSVIEELEDCYRTNSFDQWLSLLTVDYRVYYNNPDKLASEGWDAANIHDFFNLLVTTRRKGNISDLQVSRVEFVNDDKAYVYVLLEGEEFPVPQHTFIRTEETWYKGLSDEGE